MGSDPAHGRTVGPGEIFWRRRGERLCARIAGVEARALHLGEFIIEELQKERQQVLDGGLSPHYGGEANDGGRDRSTHVRRAVA